MSERPLTNKELLELISRSRESLATFIKESAGRTLDDSDKEYIRQQGRLIDCLLKKLP